MPEAGPVVANSGPLIALAVIGHLEILGKLYISAHGQGHETTFAQVVADALGVTPEDVTVVHGDTLSTFTTLTLSTSGTLRRRSGRRHHRKPRNAGRAADAPWRSRSRNETTTETAAATRHAANAAWNAAIG